MERYPKLFILAAVGYLLGGVLMGLHLGTASQDPAVTRFVHVHLNLLGFMAMFIYGVAYHILPRFNAKPVTASSLIPAHFYLVNIGLIGMAATAFAGGIWDDGPAHTAFIIFSVMEAAGIFIFAYNIIPVLMPEKTVKKEADAITGESQVSVALDKWPHLVDIFADNGFKALTNPAARATFAKNISIKQACKLHKVDEARFLSALNSAVKAGPKAGASKPVAASAPGVSAPVPVPPAGGKGKSIKRGEKAEKDTLIGPLLEIYPETKPVFEKNYGAGCFSCPGQASETVGQTAMMHNMKVEDILSEINGKIEAALSAAK
ncbi:MAG: DUF1858 domain-containing protein [Nitrospinota bacterium]|nr:DUF1858 domain-containing protein [Nitrospinota bacterium]